MKQLLTLVLLLGLALAAHGNGNMPITTKSKAALEAYYKAMKLRDNSQLEASQEQFKKALHLDPHFIMAKLQSAGAVRGFKARTEIMQAVDKMYKKSKNHLTDGEQILIEGRLAGFNGDGQKSREAVFKLAEMFPRDARLQMTPAFFENDPEKRIKQFEKVVSIDENFLPVYNNLGYAYKNTSRYKDAEKAFQKAIELDPKNPNGYDSYAELLLKMGKYEKSIETYDKALEIDPLFPSAVMGAVSNLLHLKKYDQARLRLNEIMKKAPNDGIRSGVCWALSVVNLDQGNYEMAIKELRNNMAYSEKQGDKTAMGVDYGNIGQILVYQGKIAEAKEAFAKANALFLETARNDQARENLRIASFSQNARIALEENKLSVAKENTEKYYNAVKELPRNFFQLRLVNELKGRIALKEKRYEEAIELLNKANATTAENMFRIAQAYEGLEDISQAKKMYGYVVTYRGALNYNYSVLRHDAEKRFNHL